MRTALLSFLSREWAGIAIAAVIALAGLLIGPATLAGVLLLTLALVLAIGSSLHLAAIGRSRRAFPPPGRFVEVEGTRIHVLAEGEAADTLPLVMFGGGHAAGLVMDHLHRELRGITRSILIDRPGTGWSDTGRFPRTTVREAEEMVETLRRSGEQGPFVLAGYSFGGLLVANIARRHPELVARLVLIDPTPLETIVFGPRLGAIGQMRRTALFTGMARLFGVHHDFAERTMQRNPAHASARKTFEDALGPAVETLRAVDVSAGSRLAEYDIYRELVGSHVASCGWETVVYDGDLGDMEVWLVAPGTAEEVKKEAEVATAGSEQERMINFFARSRERYLATSTRSRRVVAPPGTTHQFVYERPDFLKETLSKAVKA